MNNELAAFDHISTLQVEKDLKDTKADLQDLTEERKAFATLAKSGTQYTTPIYAFKAENRRIKIVDAKLFIYKLEAILEYRKVNRNA